jgi:hypothetical protein
MWQLPRRARMWLLPRREQQQQCHPMRLLPSASEASSNAASSGFFRGEQQCGFFRDFRGEQEAAASSEASKNAASVQLLPRRARMRLLRSEASKNAASSEARKNGAASEASKNEASSGASRNAAALEMEAASRRQSATTRVWGSIGSAEIFAEGTAYTTTRRGGRLMELGVHAARLRRGC